MKNLFCFFILISCGIEPSKNERDPVVVVPTVPSAFDQVKIVIDEQCGNSRCHAGADYLQSGAAFKASSSRIRIANGSMPKKNGPNYPLYNNEKKKILLNYLSN